MELLRTVYFRSLEELVDYIKFYLHDYVKKNKDIIYVWCFVEGKYKNIRELNLPINFYYFILSELKECNSYKINNEIKFLFQENDKIDGMLRDHIYALDLPEEEIETGFIFFNYNLLLSKQDWKFYKSKRTIFTVQENRYCTYSEENFQLHLKSLIKFLKEIFPEKISIEKILISLFSKKLRFLIINHSEKNFTELIPREFRIKVISLEKKEVHIDNFFGSILLMYLNRIFCKEFCSHQLEKNPSST